MARVVIAVLLTGLVMPGLGHIYLRHFKRGGLLIAGMTVLFIAAATSAFLTLSGAIIIAGEDASTEEVFEQIAAQPPTFLFIVFGLMFLTWLFAIIDVIRKARSFSQPGEIQ